MTHDIAKRLPPAAHFTTDTWINDPNGLIYHEGVYHLFFQNNPYGPDWADLSWGHAVSTDLVRWQARPPAIVATEEELVFSGSAVVDHWNTSGLGRHGQAPLVAVYTGVGTALSARPGIQAQCLAYSHDDGDTWTRYERNPVLDIGSTYSRDPKVFRYGGEDGHWVMLIVLADEQRVAIYTSTNLIDWDLASHFGPAHAIGGLWECPDLFPLTVEETGEQRWVLLISLNPGGPAGGSGTQYFVGDFDGFAFIPEAPCPPSNDAASWVDHGTDCYAGVTFNEAPEGRRIFIGWANNWDYAHELPTAPWRSAMTLARDLSLVRLDDGRLRLRQTPVLAPQSTEVRVVTVAASSETGTTEILASPPGNRSETLRIVVDGDQGVITCDRRSTHNAGFHPTFAGVVSAPLLCRPVTEVTIAIDRGIVEIFADSGLTVLTQVLLSADPLTDLQIRTQGDSEAGSVIADTIRSNRRRILRHDPDER